MKRTLTVVWMVCILAVCMALVPTEMQAAPYSGICSEGVTWRLDEAGMLLISGNGAMPDYAEPSDAPWYGIRSRIRRVVIGNMVTNVGDHTFYGCENLVAANIGYKVAAVGNAAFQDCGKLTSVVFYGNAPAVGQNVFTGVTARAVYIAAGNLWSEEVCKSFGGNVTWEVQDDRITTGACGDSLIWLLDNHTGCLTVSGEGDMWDYSWGWSLA